MQRAKQRLGWLRALHGLLAVLSLAFVALLVVVNGNCVGPLGKPALFAWVVLSLSMAAALIWAASGDDDLYRTVGSVAAGALTGVWLGTLSLPVAVVPLSIAGWFRLPNSRSARIALAVLVPVALLACGAVPYVLRMTPSTSCG